MIRKLSKHIWVYKVFERVAPNFSWANVKWIMNFMGESESRLSFTRPTKVGRYTGRFPVVFTTFLFACGLAYEALYHIFRGSLAFSLIPQDGFYYYYLTAKHIAATGFSSFDGIVPTNGYHPLWMWCIAILSFLARENDSNCFVMIEAVQIFSSVITAAFVLKLFRELYG